MDLQPYSKELIPATHALLEGAPQSSKHHLEPYRDTMKLEMEDDWVIWKFLMSLTLRVRGLEGITLGRDKKPEGEALADPAYQLWVERDAAARHQIVCNLSHHWLLFVIEEMTAEGTWRRLLDEFESQHPDKQAELRLRYTTLEYVEGTSMRVHLDKLQILRAHLILRGVDLPDEHHAWRMQAHLPPSWHDTASICREMKTSIEDTRQILIEEAERRADHHVSLHQPLGNNRGRGNSRRRRQSRGLNGIQG